MKNIKSKNVSRLMKSGIYAHENDHIIIDDSRYLSALTSPYLSGSTHLLRLIWSVGRTDKRSFCQKKCIFIGESLNGLVRTSEERHQGTRYVLNFCYHVLLNKVSFSNKNITSTWKTGYEIVLIIMGYMCR